MRVLQRRRPVYDKTVLVYLAAAHLLPLQLLHSAEILILLMLLIQLSLHYLVEVPIALLVGVNHPSFTNGNEHFDGNMGWNVAKLCFVRPEFNYFPLHVARIVGHSPLWSKVATKDVPRIIDAIHGVLFLQTFLLEGQQVLVLGLDQGKVA